MTIAMGTFFMAGWMIFPVAWTLGPFGLDLVAASVEGRMYIAGDLLAKNGAAACTPRVAGRHGPCAEPSASPLSVPSEPFEAPSTDIPCPASENAIALLLAATFSLAVHILDSGLLF